MESTHSIRISDKDIRSEYSSAHAMIESARYEQKTDERPKPTNTFAPISPIGGQVPLKVLGKTENNDLMSALRSEDDMMLSPIRHAVLYDLRRALAVGMTVGRTFVGSLGFDDLAEKSRKNGILAGTDKEKFSALVKTLSVVVLHVTVLHFLSTRSREAKEMDRDLDSFPTDSSKNAVSWFISSLIEAVKGKNDDEMEEAVASTTLKALDRIENDAHRLMGSHFDEYVHLTYVVEEDDFRVHGFERSNGRKKQKSIEIVTKKPTDVIGNHIAKMQAERLAKMIVCYDFDRCRNPFVDVGGFIFTTIGDGQPGTGKTTLIQMTAGLIKAYCDGFGYPFHYENFGIDQISEYQGVSGRNCRAFIDRVIDQKSIGFGTIDDIDQVAGNRSDEKSSTGQQEVTAALMDAFAGATTNVRGNATFFMASNYPEKVDDALRQRAGTRWLIDGPITRSDYIDIFQLLLGKSSVPLGNHELFSEQSLKKMIEKSYDEYNEPKEEALRAVWNDVLSKSGHPKTIVDIGTYLFEIKKKDERFTGRAVKNITDAIKTRAMDVDLPDEWFSTKGAFVEKPYETKKAMLEELRRPITLEMVIQEVNRYADSEFRYADKSDEAEVASIVRRVGNERKARAILESEG